MRKIQQICKDSVYRKILSAFTYGVVGIIIAHIFTFLGGVLIARCLSVVQYGLFNRIKESSNTFAVIASSGFSGFVINQIVKQKNQKEPYDNRLLKIYGVFICILLILLYLFKKSILQFAGIADIGSDYYLFITVFFSVLAFYYYNQAVFVGNEAFRWIAIIELVRSTFFFLFVIILTINNNNNLKIYLFGLLFSYLLTIIIQVTVIMIKINKSISRKKINTVFIRNTIHFVVPITLSNLSYTPIAWIVNSLITREQGIEEYAIFALCMYWMNLLNFIPSQFNQIRPIYTELYQKRERNKLKKVYFSITCISVIVIGFIGIILIFFKDKVLLLYGNEYLKGKNVFVILIITSIVITMQSQAGNVFQSIDKNWNSFWLNLIWDCTLFILIYILKRYGILGYSFSYLLSYVIYVLIVNISVYKLIGDNNEK